MDSGERFSSFSSQELGEGAVTFAYPLPFCGAIGNFDDPSMRHPLISFFAQKQIQNLRVQSRMILRKPNWLIRLTNDQFLKDFIKTNIVQTSHQNFGLEMCCEYCSRLGRPPVRSKRNGISGKCLWFLPNHCMDQIYLNIFYWYVRSLNQSFGWLIFFQFPVSSFRPQIFMLIGVGLFLVFLLVAGILFLRSVRTFLILIFL